MKLELITPPATLPVSLDSVKNYLRVLDDHQDSEIELMIKTAIKRAEDITNRQLGGVATFRLYLDCFPASIHLPKAPLRSVKRVAYKTLDNTEMELEADEWWVDDKATPATICFKIRTVNDLSDKPNSIIVEFEAGYNKLPIEVESWVKVQVATIYEHREKFVVGANISEFGNRYIDNLLDSLRIIPI